MIRSLTIDAVSETVRIPLQFMGQDAEIILVVQPDKEQYEEGYLIDAFQGWVKSLLERQTYGKRTEDTPDAARGEGFDPAGRAGAEARDRRSSDG